MVPLRYFLPRWLLLAVVSTVLAACSTGHQITRTEALPEATDAPYEKILVIALFDSFDTRRYLENEVVKKMAEFGVDAAESTSMMDTKTPVTRATFLAMVDKINADAVLVIHLESLRTTGKVRRMRAEATYNLQPTYYYNVFTADLTEYREPPAVDMTHYLSLMSELYSVKNEDVVWAIEAKSKVAQKFDVVRDYTVFVDEAEAIVDFMAGDELIAQ